MLKNKKSQTFFGENSRDHGEICGCQKKIPPKKISCKGGVNKGAKQKVHNIEPSRDVSAVYASQKIEKSFFNAKNDVFFSCKKTKMTEFFIFKRNERNGLVGGYYSRH